MKSIKALGLLSSAVAFCALSSPVQAYSWDETTYFTFAAPIKVPGATLPAGSYVFRLADSYTNRDIVQIMNPEQTKIYATVVALPTYRQEPTNSTVITFAASPAAAAPDAVQAWFYPLMTYGHKFVYLNPPRKQKRIEIGADLHGKASQ
jgi:hypothetical protein